MMTKLIKKKIVSAKTDELKKITMVKALSEF
jgi:hypothetical protein